jgi:glycosyltransferase involved in cell wall biosynthesis
MRSWRPDIVLASAPPHSGLIVARRIARACRVPWIAELRDPWTDDPYYNLPRWRWWLDRLLERSILNDSAGLVAVTPLRAEIFARRFRQPVACVQNGYVEEDFPADRSGPPAGDLVSILYTGNIYQGYRDPSALFRAIELLGNERQRVAVHFYGPTEEDIYGLSAAQPVRARIVVHDRVSYRASLALQCSADVLLLLQWADRREAGNIPAKFYEYLGARRPILMLGYEHGNLAEMVRGRKAGFVSNDPAKIAAQLREWIAQRPAGIPPPDPEAREGMMRAEQFAKLERFLVEVRHIGKEEII